MAGERLAKITIEASWALNDYVRGAQTQHVRLRLGGVWVDYYRGAFTSQHEFAVPDPDDVGRDYVKQGVDNLLALVKFDVQSAGLPYTVSASRDLGNELLTNQPRIAFDIEATQYDSQLNLAFQNFFTGSPNGWTVTQNLTTLQPIAVTQTVTPAGIYGSATGSIYLNGYQGNTGPLTYTWADDPTAGQQRPNLKAGSYTCVVRDQDGVSTTVTCVVTSDAQLQVVVQQTEDSITLLVSGGVAPYAVAWTDGATTLLRTGLASGTYPATVTDAHGATQLVSVTLQPSRCYFSQNPVRLALDAGAAYRADPTTKPNLSFVAQVWVELDYLSGTFVQVGPELEQPADVQGRTVFDVQALLDACVAEHRPALFSNLVSRADSLFKRFYLKSAEKYGTPPVPAALSQAQVHMVLCGGLDPAGAAAGTWPGYQAAAQPFLTWEPDYQRVLPQQPAYLYYQHATADTAVEVWLKVRHLDGTSSQSALTVILPVKRWEVYCLAVGPAARGLTGPDVAGYDVWLATSAGTLVSQVRHFVLERAYYPQQRFFLYTNSLGGVNVLAALGAAKQTLEVVATEAQRPAYDPELGDVATLERLGTGTVSVATGPRRRGQVLADQELLQARRVTLLKDGVYWPGTVVAATFTVRDEAEGLASLAFDFKLPQQRHFSPHLPQLVAGQLVTPVAGGEGPTP
ncbi:MAG: hypothetical protein ACRYFX_19550 [Janthinobacterium lividum]